MSLSRFAPLTGLIGIGGVIAGLALDNFPDGSYSDSRVAAWFDVHGTGRWIASGACIAIGGTLLLVFAATLSTRADSSAGTPTARHLLRTAGTAWAVLTMMGGSLWLSVPLAVKLFSATPSRSLMLMAGPAYATLVTVCAFAAALVAAALTTVSRSTGLLPRWLTRAGYPAAVLMLTNVLLPMAVVTLFFAAVSIALVRRPVPAPASPAREPVPA